MILNEFNKIKIVNISKNIQNNKKWIYRFNLIVSNSNYLGIKDIRTIVYILFIFNPSN
jgi:hypothetical protein